MAKRLKTLDRGIEIVRYMCSQGETTVSEISEEFQIPVSTASDYLMTLRANELVLKEGRGYRVSNRLLEFGAKTRYNIDLFRTGRSEVDELAEEINERVYLMREENGHGVTLYTARGQPRIKVDAYDGLHTPLHTTAGGKAILANLPKERRNEIYPDRNLSAVNKKTITEWDKLVEELTTIREQGVAFEREERVAGLSSVGAPILDRSDNVIGAIACYGPTSRIEGESDESSLETDFVNRIQEAANIIEVNLHNATRGEQM